MSFVQELFAPRQVVAALPICVRIFSWILVNGVLYLRVRGNLLLCSFAPSKKPTHFAPKTLELKPRGDVGFLAPFLLKRVAPLQSTGTFFQRCPALFTYRQYKLFRSRGQAQRIFRFPLQFVVVGCPCSMRRASFPASFVDYLLFA